MKRDEKKEEKNEAKDNVLGINPDAFFPQMLCVQKRRNMKISKAPA